MTTRTIKSFLVTGGTTGIGFATAQLLASEGMRVLITGTDQERLDAAIAALGERAHGICSDSGSASEARKLGRFVEQTAGTLQGVFINAGACYFGPVESLSEQQIARMTCTRRLGI